MAADQSIRVEVDGLRRLRSQLRKLGSDLGDIKAANAGAAALVAAAAAARAPRRTGRLASSVRGNRAVSRATVSAGRAAIPYAGPVHYGWPAHGIEAQPFVIEAAQETEQQWLALYQAGIDQAVDNVAGTY